MTFFDDYNQFKNYNNLKKSFFIKINASHLTTILENVYIETNHTFNKRESRASATTNFSYQERLGDIIEILNIEHGVFHEGSINPEDYPDGIIDEEHYLKLAEENVRLLECNINDFTNTLIDYKFDNYTRNIKLMFDFHGNMEDTFVFDYHNYYVYMELLAQNKEAPYWTKLALQAIGLNNEEKYELALLLMFSSFDNFITLEIEKLTKFYYKEFNIEKLEFGKKVSLLLKHSLKVNPGVNEMHSVKDLIYKMYDELYTQRNAVAHGNNREIESEDFEKCFDMLIFTYIAINEHPVDNKDLLRKIKNYK